ncbi:tRNA (adenosine(37)-N6)-threonylcarbamoyltransferase complex dimerization subunit type 1 TsaB [Undibacterium sp. SXout11W]|uniref:tRNA (adenosine(37)-N6)-threonylcarbamoyltransferase complex dimerization subunit type 1 TsaB n=1 Tax=Undibacterium sp. SXout11W TaxID=3413050 RepID=UPI003BF3AE83
MTTILAIETTTELASAALFVEDQMFVRELSGVQTHSQGILPALQSLLAEAGVTLSDCDAIAFGCGPGAFTGIRTACGVVQGLAFGADLGVIPVVSLHAMALAAAENSNLNDFVCVLDARMNEVYWAHYHLNGGVWTEISPPALSKLDDIQVPEQFEHALVVLGCGLVLPSQLQSHTSMQLMPHAIQVARLGLQAFQAGSCVSPEDAQPLYLRNKIALTTAERAIAKEAQ